MPQYGVDRVVAALNRQRKALNGSRVLALGIAYKRDVDDMRESPSVTVMERLRDGGAHVAYSDPYWKTFPKLRQHRFDLASVPVTQEPLASYYAVVLLTDHTAFAY